MGTIIMKKILLILIISIMVPSAFAKSPEELNVVESGHFLQKPASINLLDLRIPGPVNCLISCDQQLRYCLTTAISNSNECHYQYKQCVIVCGE